MPWSSQASPRFLALLFLAAVLLLAGSWMVTDHGRYLHYQIDDRVEYYHYAKQVVVHHQVPYRDFALEYPPLSLVSFLPPELGRATGAVYGRRFALESFLFATLLLGATALILRELCASRRRATLVVVLVALLPVLVGGLNRTRFDLLPAMLVAFSLYAALRAGRREDAASAPAPAVPAKREPRGWPLAAGALLGLAFSAKIYPALLLPLLLMLWPRRRALAALLGFVATTLAAFLPFLVLAPHGVVSSLVNQGRRPLQIESLAAAVYLNLAHPVIVSTFGSQNIAGSLALWLAFLSALVVVVAVLVCYRLFWRERGQEALLRYGAAAVLAFCALGKVLSPQYLIWLVPLVALVAGRRGLVAAGALVGACLLTQGWFPLHYWDLVGEETRYERLLLLRDLLLVLALALLLSPARWLEQLNVVYTESGDGDAPHISPAKGGGAGAAEAAASNGAGGPIAGPPSS